MKNQLHQLIEDTRRAKDRAQFIKVIDQIVALSENYDDNYAVDVLCYLITVTQDWDIRFRALTVIDRIRGR